MKASNREHRLFNPRRIVAVLLMASLAGLLFSQGGCTTKVPPPTAPPPSGPSVVPDSVQSIFNANCLSGCHEGNNALANLNLEPDNAYSALIDVASQSCAPLVLVRPFKADSSCLVERMKDPQGSMPPSGMLSPQEIATVENWVNQGAGSP